MKIVQISAVPAADHTTNTGCFVLCDDGTFLFYDLRGGWTVLEQLPDLLTRNAATMAEKDEMKYHCDCERSEECRSTHECCFMMAEKDTRE